MVRPGRVVTLFWEIDKNRYRTEKVLITDTEQATPKEDSNNPSGFWYWVAYS